MPGVDGVEFDVRSDADGVPVVIHDDDLRRVQGVDLEVCLTPAEELARHGIPRLAEVLAALPPACFLDVELKVVPGTRTAGVLRSARGARPSRAIVSSFVPEALRAITRLAPGWERWLNVEEGLGPRAVNLAVALGCGGISAEHTTIDARSAWVAHSAGLALAAWTVRDVAEVRRLDRLGVSAICAEDEALQARVGAATASGRA